MDLIFRLLHAHQQTFQRCVHRLILVILFSTFSAFTYAATPTFTVAFEPNAISLGGVSTMTYTIDNTAEATPVGGLTLSDILPTGILVASPSRAITTCTNGTYTLLPGSGSISFEGYRLGAGNACTLSVDVTSSTTGSYTHTTEGPLNTSSGSAGTASDTLVVDGSILGLSATFSPSTITPGGVSTLTYIIDNSAGSSLSINQFFNNLPSGMLVSKSPDATFSCVGGSSRASMTADPNSQYIQLSNGFVAAGDTCTASVKVTAESAGHYIHQTAELFQNGQNIVATAELTVNRPFMYTTFPASSSPGSVVAMSFTITNTDRVNSASAINFTNDLNATLSGLTANSLPADDFCGPGSTATGTSNINVSGVNLASGDSCSFELTVLVPSDATTGAYSNNTSAINLILGSATTKPAVTSSLIINTAPKLTTTLIAGTVAPGEDITIRYVLTNTDSSNEASTISFTQDLISPLTGPLTVKLLSEDGSCGTGSAFFSSDEQGVPVFIVSDANLAAGASCTFDLVATLPAGANIGQSTFTTSGIEATVNGKTVYGNPADTNLVVIAAPELMMNIVEHYAAPGADLTMEFTLNYHENASANANNVGFTLNLDDALSGLVSTTNAQNDICGAGSSFIGTNILTLSGATLVPNTGCTFSVTLQLPDQVTPGTLTASSSTVSGTVSGQSVTSAAVSDTVVVSGLTFTKSFIDSSGSTTASPPLPGDNLILRYQISNAATALAATGISFTDKLNGVIPEFSATSLPTEPCGGASLISGTTSITFSGGQLEPGSSCTFDVSVTVPTSAAAGSYNSVTSELFATVNGNNTANPSAQATLNVQTLTLLLSSAVGNITTSTSIPVDITFSRNVINFEMSDLSIINGTATNFSGTGDTYQVDIVPTNEGNVSINLSANAADDAVNTTIKSAEATELTVYYFLEVANTIVTSPTTAASVTGTSTVISGIHPNDDGAKFYLHADYDNNGIADSSTPLTEALVSNDTWSITADLNERGVHNFVILYNYRIDRGEPRVLDVPTITEKTPNYTPVISGSPVTATEDLPYTFTPTVTDANLIDTTTFNITNKPSWASFDTSSGVLSGTPTNSDVGTTANINITVTDAANATDTITFDLAVINTNDAPVIAGISTGTSTEDDATQVTGALSITDDDIGEAIFIAQTNFAGTYGAFNLATSGNWTYDLDNTSPNVQALADGATLTDSFTATSADGTNSQVVTVTITGINGVATITGTSTGAATEDDASQVTGSLSITDEDTGETVFAAQTTTAGIYGAFNLAASGNWTYNLDNTSASVQALADGATSTDSFTATSADGTDSQVVTVTITGINGLATITGTSTGAATEDDASQVTGSLSIADEDTGETVFAAQADSEGDYGYFSLTLTGTWRYQLDGSNLEVQILPEGETLTDSFTVSSIDGTASQVITITITGINDVATITGTSIADTNEDNKAQIGGSLSITDKDTGEALFMMQTGVAGTYGTFNIDNQGNWTFTLANNNTLVQQLSSGEQLTDSFVVMSIDGTDSQVITVTVFGANDAPYAVPDNITLAISVTHTYVIDVLANDSDIEGDALSIIGVNTSLGTVSTNGENLTLTTQAGFVGQVALTYTITDGNNTFSKTTANLNITGVLTEAAPVITVPETVEVNATGLYTKVDLGVATALNSQGQPLPIALVDGEPLFRPGNNIAYWQATDPTTGLTTVASQNVIVHPLISLGKDQVVVEGKKVSVDIILNGEAPVYPVVIGLTISGSVDDNDYNLENQEITINTGTQASVLIDIVQDNNIEGNETLLVSLGEGNMSGISHQVITIIEGNIAPKVSLSSSQKAEGRRLITPTDGLVSIQAIVVDANEDNISTQWLYDPALTISEIDGFTLTLDPSELEPGIYNIGMSVTDDGEGSLSTTQTIYLEVLTSLAVLTDVDSDGDLIPDNEEGHSDSNQDGIPDFQDAIAECNVMPGQVLTQNRFLVEGEPGVCLRKGNTLADGETGSVQLTLNDLIQSIGTDSAFQNVGGIFDYIATGLPIAGQQYQIVLTQTHPIPTDASYRKFSPLNGWGNFVEDTHNQLHSTTGQPGYCPPPSSNTWESGLNEGHWCVRLTLNDGGANDNDGIANQTIEDPGGVAVAIIDNAIPKALPDTAIIKRNESAIIDVLLNDTDEDGDNLTIVFATANFGTVNITNDDQLNYSTKAAFVGEDTITYSISDGNGGIDSTTVTINVYANHAPIAVNDNANTDDRTPITIKVLINDSDIDNDPLTVTAVSAEQGSVIINLDNSLTYTPVDGFNGTVLISYTIDDGMGEEASAQVTVTVKGYKTVTVTNKSKGGSIGYMVLGLIGLTLWRLRRGANKKIIDQVKLTLTCVALLSSLNLAAAETHWFIHGNVGQSHSNADNTPPKNIGITKTQWEETDNSYSLGAGVTYDDFSFILSYEDLGNASSSYTGEVLNTASFHQALIDSAPKLVDGFSLETQYTLWQGELLNVSAGMGILAWKLKYRSQLSDSVIDVNESGTDFFYNLGLGYKLTDNIEANIGIRRYNLSINDVNNITVGISYHF